MFLIAPSKCNDAVQYKTIASGTRVHFTLLLLNKQACPTIHSKKFLLTPALKSENRPSTSIAPFRMQNRRPDFTN